MAGSGYSGGTPGRGRTTVLADTAGPGGIIRVLVVSDTHGNTARLEAALRQQPKAALTIHLGDGEWDMDEVCGEFPGRQFLSVAGNCDFGSSRPDRGETVIGGKRIFYTHGHAFFVKSGLDRVVDEAVTRGADILLFGHTHIPVSEYRSGLYILNPGSLGYPRDGVPTYGVIDITPGGGVAAHIAEL